MIMIYIIMLFKFTYFDYIKHILHIIPLINIVIIVYYNKTLIYEKLIINSYIIFYLIKYNL